MKNEKRILAMSLFVTMSLLFLTSACKDQGTQKTEASEPIEVKAPEQIISVSQAKDMYEQYSNRRAPLIKRYEDSVQGPENKFDVARYTAYDYKTIKQYLAYIEQEAKMAGVEISTLRLYFANYPDKERFANGKEVKHPRQNSIFLMPTLKSEGLDYGFFIREGEKGNEAVLLNGQLETYTQEGIGVVGNPKKYNEAGFLPLISSTKAILNNNTQNGKSLILNEGNSAPPPYH